MGLTQVFDVNRVSNLETRLDSDESIAVTNNDAAFQTIPKLKITGTVNSLVTQVDPAVNAAWWGIMQDDTLYNLAIGRFTTASKAIEIRAYFDNLTFRTGRSAQNTSADMNFITNDSGIDGVSQDINLMPKGSLRISPNNAGLKTNGLEFFLTGAGSFPMFRSINTGISNMALKFASNGIHCKDYGDTTFEPFYGSAFNVTSDVSFKENISDYTSSALEQVKGTRVRKYNLKDKPNERDRIGLVRQEAPDQLHSGEESLDLYQMCSMLWKAVQELSAEVEQLKGSAGS